MTGNSLHIEYVATASLKENPRSARRHSKKKITQLAESIVWMDGSALCAPGAIALDWEQQKQRLLLGRAA